MQRSTDPCAEAAGKLTRFEGSFALPMKTGPVTLTAIEGDFVSFETRAEPRANSATLRASSLFSNA